MKRYLIALLLGLLLGGFCFWWNSPTQVLTRKTTSLLESISFPAQTPALKRQLQRDRFCSFFAPSVSFPSSNTPPFNSEVPLEEIEHAFSWLCSHALSSQFSIQKIHSVSIHSSSVTLSFSALVSLSLPNSSPIIHQPYSVSLTWQSLNHEWKITHAQWSPSS